MKIVFRFVKSMVYLMVLFFSTIKKFLLSYFPNFHGKRSGGSRGGGGARS